MSLHVISLGAGVQSSVMLLMAATGELEPFPAAAIFADTQWEPRRVYGHLAWLESEVVRLTDGKLPIYRVTAGDIRSGVLSAKRRFTSMPLFTASGGMGRRQCTRQYKIAPIKKKVREILGVAPRHRVPKGQTLHARLSLTPSRCGWTNTVGGTTMGGRSVRRPEDSYARQGLVRNRKDHHFHFSGAGGLETLRPPLDADPRPIVG